MSEPLFLRPSSSSPSEQADDILASDNALFRERIFVTEPALADNEIASGALVQWEKEGAIFSVPYRGERLFFSYQFEQGHPRPAVKAALSALPDELSPWQRAAWFSSTNGWLDDDAPRDRLDDIEAVVAAARRETEDPIG